ncbi:MAG: SDR family oxidoreductase [Alicyclobacillus sp.]|nr:SDR family oxidoreductase [Alicyclobacillus sp.]
MQSMQSEVVVLIGGSGGIGQAAARRFAQAGAHVVLVARGQEALERAAAQVHQAGGQASILTADVSQPGAATALAKQVEQTLGRVDVLVYGAAVFHAAPVTALDLDVARRAMDINYWGAVYAVQAFLPLVRAGQRKCIALVSSLSVHCTPAFFTAYAAPKHALHGFALSLRQELAPEGIRVVLVAPGPVDTGLIEGYLHGDLYRLPPGVPVLTPDEAARGLVQAVLQRRQQVVLPRRFAPLARLSIAFPVLLDMYYRWTLRHWRESVRQTVAATHNADSPTTSVPAESPCHQSVQKYRPGHGP